LRSKGESKAFNGTFDGEIFLTRIHPRERMPPHEEEMKAQHGQAEIIMICGSLGVMERVETLQFWGSKMGHAYFTEVVLPTYSNLEGVTIDKLHDRVAGHNDIPLIHVANDMPMTVDRIECSSHVPCDIHQERPVHLWKLLLTMRWAIEVVYGLVPSHLGHQKAAYWSMAAQL
jgi:hypothetical protein